MAPADLDHGLWLLDRIEREMPSAKPEVQWTMNNILAMIGIHHAWHRKRAIAIGEKIGLYRETEERGTTFHPAPVRLHDAAARRSPFYSLLSIAASRQSG